MGHDLCEANERAQFNNRLHCFRAAEERKCHRNRAATTIPIARKQVEQILHKYLFGITTWCANI